MKIACLITTFSIIGSISIGMFYASKNFRKKIGIYFAIPSAIIRQYFKKDIV